MGRRKEYGQKSKGCCAVGAHEGPCAPTLEEEKGVSEEVFASAQNRGGGWELTR